MLFSYYALLNAGILGIAWFKAWRVLNLLGFAFTFIVGTVWGVTRYRPELFATTEPFLVLFFLFYVAIAVLYALRRPVELRNYVDAGLVFGTPLVAAGLQSGLIRHIEYGWRSARLRCRRCTSCSRAPLFAPARGLAAPGRKLLGARRVFATLAIPLPSMPDGPRGLGGGGRCDRVGRHAPDAGGVRAFGYALSWRRHCVHDRAGGGAGARPSPYPIVNSAFVGSMLVALSGFSPHGSRALPAIARRTGASRRDRTFVWGFVWWLFAGVAISTASWRSTIVPAARRVPCGDRVAFAILARPCSWPAARVPQMLLIPVSWSSHRGHRAPVVDAGSRCSPMAASSRGRWPSRAWRASLAIRPPEDAETSMLPPTIEPWHAGLFWLVLLMVTHDVAWAGPRIVEGHTCGVGRLGPRSRASIVATCALVRSSSWPSRASPRLSHHRIVPVALCSSCGRSAPASTATAIPRRFPIFRS